MGKKKNVLTHEKRHGSKVHELHEKEEVIQTQESDRLKLTSYICILVHSVFVLCMYIYTSYRSLPGGDSGELIVAAHELGVAHPPGYPLFTMMLWCAIKVLSWGSVAWRANMFNAVMSAAASAMYTITLYKYTRSASTSILCSSLWSFNSLTWTWSTCVEVFCLNNFFVVLLLFLMHEFENSDAEKHVKLSYMGSFVCGLALCNQHTIVVYVFVIALWVLHDLKTRKKLTFRVFCTIVTCFLLGLVPYIYLPLSCILHNARWTWGNQADVEGFLTHLLRVEYGTFSLSAGDRASSGFMYGLSVCVQHIVTEFTPVGAVMLVIGVALAVKRGGKSILIAMVMCVLYIVLFSWRANLDIKNKLFLGVVERFWMQSNMVVLLVLAVGVSASFRSMSRIISSKKSWIVELSLSCVICAIQIQRNYSACNQRDNTVVAEFGSRLYHNMPNNTLILSVGDLPSNTLRYLYLCENERPDITVLDQELMTYKWFVPKLRHVYPTVTFPGHHMAALNGMQDGQTVFNLKSFLDANFKKRPLISCIGKTNAEMYLRHGYQLFPYGPCSILWKPENGFDFKSTEAGAINISAGWNYLNHGFDERSWERVATDEMWNAKVNMGLKLYEMAVSFNETTKQYTGLMTGSYRLYKQAVEKEKLDDMPAFWHRNFALACERMLRIEHDYNKSEILEEIILHFEEYMKKDSTDESVPLIRQSVKNLKQYIGKV